MADNITFTMIKPDATAAGNTGKIIDKIIEAGFQIKAMKWTQLSKEEAGKFYEVHKERPFYGELVDYMSSGPIVAAILQKAEEGTIRRMFAKSIAANAVHGSDSNENASIEGSFFFTTREHV